MKEIIDLLIENNKTISTMESCTGGALANEITNVPGSSNVFNYSAITYSNSFKIKMGVDKELIQKKTVYSIEVANDMAKKISEYANSNYGVGITGKLKRIDENNLYGLDDIVYLSIYDRDNDKYYNEKIKLLYDERIDNKKQIIEVFIKIMKTLFK